MKELQGVVTTGWSIDIPNLVFWIVAGLATAVIMPFVIKWLRKGR